MINSPGYIKDTIFKSYSLKFQHYCFAIENVYLNSERAVGNLGALAK